MAWKASRYSRSSSAARPGINGTAAKYIMPNHVVHRSVLPTRANIKGEKGMIVLILKQEVGAGIGGDMMLAKEERRNTKLSLFYF